MSLCERNAPLLLQDSYAKFNDTALRGMSLESVDYSVRLCFLPFCCVPFASVCLWRLPRVEISPHLLYKELIASCDALGWHLSTVFLPTSYSCYVLIHSYVWQRSNIS